MVNTAAVFDRLRAGAFWQHLQPGAASQLLPTNRVHPNFPIDHIFGYCGIKYLPALDFLSGSRQTTITVLKATFTALVTFFHGVDDCPGENNAGLCIQMRPLASTQVATT